MRAAAPAPVWTTTSRPRPLNFLTDSGVAATRVSPGDVSLGTASFNHAPFFCLSVMGPEYGEEGDNAENQNERPFDASQKSRIAALMLGNVHRAGRIMGIMLCHC